MCVQDNEDLDTILKNRRIAGRNFPDDRSECSPERKQEVLSDQEYQGRKKKRTYWLKAFVVSGFDHMQLFHKLYYLIRTLNIFFSSFINNIIRSLRKPQSARHQCRRFHLQSLNLNMYIHTTYLHNNEPNHDPLTFV